jgi:hypothetical protein
MEARLAFVDRKTFRHSRLLVWLAVIALVVGLPAACAFNLGYLPIRRLDAETWRNVERVDVPPVRLHMVEWLIRSGRLDGLTRAQIAALLGPASDSGYFRDWDFVYWLGPERGLFSIDSEWLVIRIGPDGRVADYRIVSD